MCEVVWLSEWLGVRVDLQGSIDVQTRPSRSFSRSSSWAGAWPRRGGWTAPSTGSPSELGVQDLSRTTRR